MDAAADAVTHDYFELGASSTLIAASSGLDATSYGLYHSAVLLPKFTSHYRSGAIETTTQDIEFTTAENDTTHPVPFNMMWSNSEVAEVVYQILFFAVGTPINIIALRKFSKSSRSISSEVRLMRLSRQLLIAHLMVLGFYCLWRTYWLYTVIWTQGNLMCKIYSFLTALPFHLWSNLVAAIAADMLYCIRMPLRSVNNGSKRVSWLIGISWVSAIVCAAPMMLLRGTVVIPGTDYEQCYALVEDFNQTILVVFNTFHVVTVFYVPLFIIVFCDLTIWMTLRTQMAERRLLGDDERRSHSINARFLMGTVTIMCAFIITWMPYQVLAMMTVICSPDSNCQKIVTDFSWLQAILIASTCINPFIYKFGIFRTIRRTGSNGYCTWHTHSQMGAESNANAKVSSASGFRNDFYQSMRSLGPNANSNSAHTITASNGTLNATNGGTVVNVRLANDVPRLISRQSTNAIAVSTTNDKKPVRRKFYNMYRSGVANATSAESSPASRCCSTVSMAPPSSASARPLLALSAKTEEDDKNEDTTITSAIKLPYMLNGNAPASSDPCLNQSLTQNLLATLSK